MAELNPTTPLQQHNLRNTNLATIHFTCSKEDATMAPSFLQLEDYKKIIHEFCQHRDHRLEQLLMQWANMRQLFQWQLTKDGLKLSLNRLNQCAGEEAHSRQLAREGHAAPCTRQDIDACMIEIVQQSLDRHWKTFWPLKQTDSIILARNSNSKQTTNPLLVRKRGGGLNRDLSFLER